MDLFAQKQSMSSPANNLMQVDVPRVYLSDASMFHRWTDRFRVVYQVDKALQKGYTQVFTHFVVSDNSIRQVSFN